MQPPHLYQAARYLIYRKKHAAAAAFLHSSMPGQVQRHSEYFAKKHTRCRSVMKPRVLSALYVLQS
jgi:hypothetical protein